MWEASWDVQKTIRGGLMRSLSARWGTRERWCYPGEDSSFKSLNLPFQARKSHWSIVYSEGYGLIVVFGKNRLAELRPGIGRQGSQGCWLINGQEGLDVRNSLKLQPVRFRDWLNVSMGHVELGSPCQSAAINYVLSFLLPWIAWIANHSAWKSIFLCFHILKIPPAPQNSIIQCKND